MRRDERAHEAHDGAVAQSGSSTSLKNSVSAVQFRLVPLVFKEEI